MNRPDRCAAVLGSPIEHSLSPRLHRAAYEWLGLSWTYDAVDVTAPALPQFLAGLGPEWVGLSLTMPLKEAVLPLLDEVEPAALLTRAVNTVVLESGRRLGFNTDIDGLVDVLRRHRFAAGTPALVLGGGATARSAVAALARVGASRVTVVTRRASAGADLVALGADLGQDVVARGWADAVPLLREAAGAADLVVSTVPLGATDDLAVPGPLPPNALLVDVLYESWPTPLGQAWAAAGGTAVGGRDLLVAQALEQVRLMTGEPVPADVLWAALADQAGASRPSGDPPKE
jgi:shikimate dehydrogenase